MKTQELTKILGEIKLLHLRDNLENFLEAFSPEAEEVVKKLATQEQEFKVKKSLERRIRDAKLGRFKVLADFDWDWPKKINRSQLKRLLELDFVDKAANALFIGTQGVGKTMLAKNIAHQAAISGKTALFTTASDMVIALLAAGKLGTYQQKLRSYIKSDLLVIDEIGYLSFENQSADILFDVISKRYEKKSIIVTTNLAPKDWGEIFPGASCVTAMIDRLTHHCDFIQIEADSFRLKEAKMKKEEPPQNKKLAKGAKK